MGIVLDTNVLIDAEHSRLALTVITGNGNDNEAYIAVVTVAELLAGVHLAETLEARIKRSAFVEGILNAIPSLPFDEAVARTYAELYSHFLKHKPRAQNLPNVHDLQIAATAITNGFPVLTNNIKDFGKIPGLRVKKIP